MQKTVIALAIASTLTLSVAAHAGSAPISDQGGATLAQAPALVTKISARSERLALGLRLVNAAISRAATLAQANTAASAAIGVLTPFIEDGDASAAWSVGYLYATGSGVAPDRAKGIALIRLAADHGNAAAAHWLTGALMHPYSVTHEQQTENVLANHYAMVYQRLTGKTVKLVPQSVIAVAPRSTGPVATPHLIPATTRAGAYAPAPTLARRTAAVVAVGKRATHGVRAHVSGRSAHLTPALHPGSTGISHGPPRILQVAPSPVSVSSRPEPHLGAAVEQPVVSAPTSRDLDLKGALAAANAHVAELERQIVILRQEVASREADAEHLNTQAIAAIQVGDYESAIPKLRDAAAAGYSPAQANLGAMYLNGSGVPQDSQQAISLFQRAAEAGNVVAAENVGRMYEFALGVGHDPYRAIEAYERAADLGSRGAASDLSRLGIYNYTPKGRLN